MLVEAYIKMQANIRQCTVRVEKEVRAIEDY